jgi:hypothetical protein
MRRPLVMTLHPIPSELPYTRGNFIFFLISVVSFLRQTEIGERERRRRRREVERVKSGERG